MASRAWRIALAAADHAEPLIRDQVAKVWRFLRFASLEHEDREFLWHAMTKLEQGSILRYMAQLKRQSVEAAADAVIRSGPDGD